MPENSDYIFPSIPFGEPSLTEIGMRELKLGQIRDILQSKMDTQQLDAAMHDIKLILDKE